MAANYSPFMTNLDAVNVLSGGAIIDTAGYSINVYQSFLDGGTGGGLTKVGAGSLLLFLNTNTYTGATVVSGGGPILSSGSISNTPQVSIASGAVFNVSAGGFTFTGSSPRQILAGSSPTGTATITAGTGTQMVTLASGALASFQAVGGGGSTVGKISMTGDLALNGNAITVNVSAASLQPGTYPLMTCTGTLSGSANTTATIVGVALASGSTARISTTTGNSGHVDLVVTGGTGGTPVAFSGVSPSRSIFAGTTSLVMTGKVSGAGSVYPANGETITVTIKRNCSDDHH